MAGGVLAFLAGACAEHDDAALEELENLAFVPRQRLVLEGYEAVPWANCSLEVDLVIDRYELTRGRLERFEDALVDDPIPWTTVPTPEDAERLRDWPAALSYRDARAVAEARGMRLPKPHEWLHVALGGRADGFPFPWGSRRAYSGGNTLELAMNRPTPVGSFEGGRSRPFGCYDLVGNLWEWVDGTVPGYDDEVVQLTGGDGRVSVLGGSYHTRLREVYGRGPGNELRYLARTHDPRFRSPTVGARMCADAEPYLLARAADWGTGQDAAARVQSVGRRWAQDRRRFALERLLERLVDRPGAPRELRWLLEGVRE